MTRPGHVTADFGHTGEVWTILLNQMCGAEQTNKQLSVAFSFVSFLCHCFIHLHVLNLLGTEQSSALIKTIKSCLWVLESCKW